MAITQNNSQSWADYGGGVQNRLFTVNAGTKKALIVYGKNLIAVSYNGIALTQSGLFWKLVNPPVGTFNLTLTNQNNPDTFYATALCMNDVDQINPIGSVIANGGLTSSQSKNLNYTVGGVARTMSLYQIATFVESLISGPFIHYWIEGLEQSFQESTPSAGYLDSCISLAHVNTLYSGSSYSIRFDNIKTGYPSPTIFNYLPLPIQEALPQATATTGPATNIGNIVATLNGSVTGNGYTTNTYIEYGLTTAYGTQLATINSGTGSYNYSQQATGLTPNTTYNYRIVADNGNGIEYGSNLTFITLSNPVATTLFASGVSTTVGTFNASISTNLNSGTASFEYGVNTTVGVYGSTLGSSSLIGSSSPSPLSTTLTGLSTGNIVRYRVKFVVGSQTFFGLEQVFTAVAVPYSLLTTTNSLTNTSITLNGTVNPNGLATTAIFEYGTTLSYGSSTNPQILGSGAVPINITENVSGLIQNTTYFYRISATNSNGIGYSSGGSFTTYGVPTAITLPVVKDWSITTFYGIGTLNSPSGIYFFEYKKSSDSVYISSNIENIISNVAPSLEVDSLSPNTEYNYRFVISNMYGVATGSIITFTTNDTPVNQVKNTVQQNYNQLKN